MTLLYSPFESYFDTQGRPTASGQQLLARMAAMFATAEDIGGSGTFSVDDGNASGGGSSFMFEDGGA